MRTHLKYVTSSHAPEELGHLLEAALGVNLEWRDSDERGRYLTTPPAQVANEVIVQPNLRDDEYGCLEEDFAGFDVIVYCDEVEDAHEWKRRLREIHHLYLAGEERFLGAGPPWEVDLSRTFGATGSTYDVASQVAAAVGSPFDLTFEAGEPVGRVRVDDAGGVEIRKATASDASGELFDERFETCDQLVSVTGARDVVLLDALDALDAIEGLVLLVERSTWRGREQ
ncbi:MAG TPA: hypothetical protein VHN98_09970 [Acidimicrobiales bacterium]|nr:hypothetical protein [Acidimicrobiales bacterium]